MNRFTPDYVDRHMSSGAKFGDTGEVRQQDEILCLQPSAAALKFIPIFGSLFLAVFLALAWYFIDGPKKWLPMIMGPICGGVAFASIYWVIKNNVEKGPYIQLNTRTNAVSVPRLDIDFDLCEIEYLQLITGRSKTSPDEQMNLNLVVRENERLFRYLIMPSPHRPYVLKFAELANLEVREIKLGPNGFRDDALLS